LMRSCSRLVWGTTLSAICLLAGESVEGKRMTSVVRVDAKSGKLVRSVTVTPKVIAPQNVGQTPPAVVTPAASSLNEAVDRIAAQNALPPQLIHSVIKVESNYNPNAVSAKGARGLMQLIPSTAQRFGVADSFNPVENIQGGAKYLKYLLGLYGNDYALALAAYNAGEGAVAKYGTVPPYKETQNYLHLVADQLKKLSKAAPVPPAPPVTPTPETSPDSPKHMQPVLDRDGSVRYVTR